MGTTCNPPQVDRSRATAEDKTGKACLTPTRPKQDKTWPGFRHACGGKAVDSAVFKTSGVKRLGGMAGKAEIFSKKCLDGKEGSGYSLTSRLWIRLAHHTGGRNGSYSREK